MGEDIEEEPLKYVATQDGFMNFLLLEYPFSTMDKNVELRYKAFMFNDITTIDQ